MQIRSHNPIGFKSSLNSAIPASRRAEAAESPVDRVELSRDSEELNLIPPPGMTTLEENRLPPEAQQTIDIINSGNTYSRRRNNIVFHNREGALPEQEDGYYREWTVRERGQTGRKKKRFVIGSHNELFYTTNHYKSFTWVNHANDFSHLYQAR
ncbi:MAG: hypothetical protein KC800_33310 [Candidatus Eremiobacteraeota bacterium]|nr:hypothetical protein [Candidatus Eremiobacteraeota bacterium]